MMVFANGQTNIAQSSEHKTFALITPNLRIENYPWPGKILTAD